MKFIKIVIISLILTSCSAEWHLKQAIKKGIEVKKDTIRVTDTLVIDSVRVDTTVISKEIDTIFIQKDQWYVKIERVRDTLKISGGCKGDTIYIDKKIPIEKIVYKPTIGKFADKILKRLTLILLLILLLIIAIYILKR